MSAGASLETAQVPTPIGPVRLFAREGALCALCFAAGEAEAVRFLERRFGPVRLAEGEDPAGAAGRLREYLAGDLGALDAVPVDPGGTSFQELVWSALRRVAPGRTTSYSALAEAIGRREAVRAVAAANARNPVAIVIPCHRVLAAGGRLWGYGGGLERKRWLLAHEGALPEAPLF